jgi:arylsulfatase A-like enzyme
VPREYYNRFSHIGDHTTRVYYGMIAALDEAIGTILDCLDSCGVTGNTLVIFTSDNGGATYTGATDNGKLKAGKFAQFEGGIRVPMIISWKGVLPGGVTYTHPVSLTDLFATSLAAAGCHLPSDRPVDGRDLLPYLSGETKESPHPELFWRTDFNKAVRSDRYKLIWNQRDDQVFLYDLKMDPCESRNLAENYPEKVAQLQEKILEWELEMREPMWPGVMQFIFDINGEITRWAI